MLFVYVFMLNQGYTVNHSSPFSIFSSFERLKFQFFVGGLFDFSMIIGYACGFCIFTKLFFILFSLFLFKNSSFFKLLKSLFFVDDWPLLLCGDKLNCTNRRKVMILLIFLCCLLEKLLESLHNEEPLRWIYMN